MYAMVPSDHESPEDTRNATVVATSVNTWRFEHCGIARRGGQ
jgi:hypothetical protein